MAGEIIKSKGKTDRGQGTCYLFAIPRTRCEIFGEKFKSEARTGVKSLFCLFVCLVEK